MIAFRAPRPLGRRGRSVRRIRLLAIAREYRGPPAQRPRSEPARRPALPSELLVERPHIELVGPCARILMRHVPVGVCDRRRLEHVLVLELRKSLADERHIDRAVDIYVADMDAAGPEIARHHLREATQRELG